MALDPINTPGTSSYLFSELMRGLRLANMCPSVQVSETQVYCNIDPQLDSSKPMGQKRLAVKRPRYPIPRSALYITVRHRNESRGFPQVYRAYPSMPARVMFHDGGIATTHVRSTTSVKRQELIGSPKLRPNTESRYTRQSVNQ